MSANSSDISNYSILTECTGSRSKRPQGVDDNRVAEGECSPVASVFMSASQGRRTGLYPWKDLDAEAAPVESGASVA
ncbi:hypothetical protein, partial [Shewanella sp. ECSMB14102]|uniref:hypothetical protein n=1 Tax=Shewanella sp. ECSMB14102 TaxID=1579504 RepID=UPI001F1CE096